MIVWSCAPASDTLPFVTDLPRNFSRRTMLAATGALAFIGIPRLTTRTAAQSSDALQDWLAANAKAIRTLDPGAQDFGDLEPLAAAIGTARVVQLGEPSHNAGTCFAAKVRLITFLHQRLGFDVVVWESGIYDVELVEAGLHAGMDPAAAAQRGILRNWSGSEECRPLFAYAQGSHLTARPLAMAGFDSTLTSPFANLAAELRKYAAALGPESLRREAIPATEELIQAFTALTAYVEGLDAINAELTTATAIARRDALARWERETGAPLRPHGAMLERFKAAHSNVAALLRAHQGEFARIGGHRRSGFMDRVVDSLSARAVNLYERLGTDVTPSTDGGLAEQNRRDAQNAENLRWIIEQGYPDRKVIVWAHNAHVMNAYYEAPRWKTIRLDPATNTMKPHGVFLADWLGRDLYTIGFSAYEGEDGWKGLGASRIPAAREGSVEGRLKRLGHPYAFLDLRAARGAGHPLSGTQVIRVPKYDEVEIPDVARPYDGLFFIARMERATLIPS
jgi:erythromycin esterase